MAPRAQKRRKSSTSSNTMPPTPPASSSKSPSAKGKSSTPTNTSQNPEEEDEEEQAKRADRLARNRKAANLCRLNKKKAHENLVREVALAQAQTHALSNDIFHLSQYHLKTLTEVASFHYNPAIRTEAVNSMRHAYDAQMQRTPDVDLELFSLEGKPWPLVIAELEIGLEGQRAFVNSGAAGVPDDFSLLA